MVSKKKHSDARLQGDRYVSTPVHNHDTCSSALRGWTGVVPPPGLRFPVAAIGRLKLPSDQPSPIEAQAFYPSRLRWPRAT
jgi:hypothetical protein